LIYRKKNYHLNCFRKAKINNYAELYLTLK